MPKNTSHKRSSEARRAAAVLDTLKNISGRSDQSIALAAGMSRQSVVDRRTGRTAIDFDDVSAFAAAFDVPAKVFYLELPDLLRWIADNGSHLAGPSNQEILGRELVAA